MGSSAFLNDQARVNRKFILNLSQNSQIYPSSRKSVQQNTSYLDLFPKKKKKSQERRRLKNEFQFENGRMS